MNDAVLELTGLSRGFGNLLAVAEVDLRLEPGLLHAVVGENAAGKSTLFALLAGQLAPTAGTLTIGGIRLPGGDAATAYRQGVGLLHQDGSLLPELTVLENFILARPGLGRLASLSLASAVSVALAGSGVQPGQRVEDLVAAVRQRVELARLLWTGQRVLLLDEPTAILGAAEAGILFASLRQCASAGKTVVFSSHRLDEVMEHADMVHVLRQGKLVLSASRKDLGRAQVLAAMFGPAGPQAAGVRQARPHRELRPALELQGLACGNREARVDLCVAAGEIVGIVGLAGNGQSELVATLAGLLPSRTGEILVGGQLRQGRNLRAWGLRCVPGNSMDACIPSMSVAENLVMHDQAQSPYVRAAGYLTDWDAIYRHGTAVVQAENLGVTGSDKAMACLSGGNQRKLLLARELDGAGVALVAHNPEAGLDASAVQYLVRKLLDVRDRGLGIVLLAEDFDFLDQVADRLLVITAGQLRKVGSTA